MRRLIALSVALVAGCTTVTTVRVPTRAEGDLFVLSGDLKEPYESMGLLQVTRRGVMVFGFIDPAGTDLAAAFLDVLPQVRQMGGDGIINVHFHQTQYALPTRILAAVLFFVPFSSEVTVTGEVVRLRRGGPPVQGGTQL
jgi:hypothetical protein